VAYVGGRATLLYFASSLLVAIVAGCWGVVDEGVCCAATDKAPVQAGGRGGGVEWMSSRRCVCVCVCVCEREKR
jgi:hypothetical protein